MQTAIGRGALASNAKWWQYGTCYVALIVSGSDNVAVSQALETNLSGSSNTAIGKRADVSSDGISNSVAIEQMLCNSFNTIQLGSDGVSYPAITNV
jgi:hypothetical protein